MDDLRHILGLKNSTFSRWPDLRRFVLDRTVAEINHLAGFRMGYVPIKRGRKITAVKLTWGRKDLPELIEAQKELDRPRVGRIVRREGKTETIANERAVLADSLANAPGWSVIENAPEEFLSLGLYAQNPAGEAFVHRLQILASVKGRHLRQ
jgi:plasmid replication initiation protein